ncbi:MAG: UbiX family flavin prenyltransferase [Desulfobacteraceae bacterium]|nr:UbiX family flavin prenyltransferase [Desulfobacteraceae bacterium]
MKSNEKQKYVISICGASGSIYGIRLLKALLCKPLHVLLIISPSGYKVLEHETKLNEFSSFIEFLNSQGVKLHKDATLKIIDADDIAGAPASGSFVHSGMAVAPCSMKTLAKISCGIADNLITRAADVALKEKRRLVLLPRETPLSLIHLSNMTKALKAGATIIPPSPSFYSHPETIEDLVDTVVARVLDHLEIDNDLVKRWK